MSATKPLSEFAKAMRKSYASSKGGTKAAEKINILQSKRLRSFTPEDRSGRCDGVGEKA